MENAKQDEVGLYVVVEHGIVCHQQHVYQDGGFYIEERDGKFVLFDTGAYGDYIREEGTYDTLKEAFDVGSSWT